MTDEERRMIRVRLSQLEKTIETERNRSIFRGGSELDMDRCGESLRCYFDARDEWLALVAQLGGTPLE